MGTTKNPNCIYEKIKNGLSSGNDCYHSVQMSSCLISKYIRILPVFCVAVKLGPSH